MRGIRFVAGALLLTACGGSLALQDTAADAGGDALTTTVDATRDDDALTSPADGGGGDSTAGSIDAAVDALPADAPADVVTIDAYVCGPPPSLMGCCRSNSDCGPIGACARSYSGCRSLSQCCTVTGACCSSDYDCCTNHCVNGACAVCAKDADCPTGWLCFQGACRGTPGAACANTSDCFGDRCSAGACACLFPLSGSWAPWDNWCRTDADCCFGVCTSSGCQYVPLGGACRVDNDCDLALCQGGICKCLPAGSPEQGEACCSRRSSLGVCFASPGDPCSTLATDCYGGTCTGTCACVGPGGGCTTDTDCCAGATKCNQDRCQ
jgi:hypothetical protein